MQIGLSRVSHAFTDGPLPLSALESIDLDIASGEFVSIIGPSGCGKSTLLRIVAGQLVPTGGTVTVHSQSPTVARQGKQIAWMAQSSALLPWKTVIANVVLPQKVNRRAARAAPDAMNLLGAVDLLEFAEAYPGALSGGMQQRVALARAIATGASVWLMDEPFAALDELTREGLTHTVLELWHSYHPTVLWVTHHIGEAVRMADRIVVMTSRPGRIKTIVAVDHPRPRDETAPEIVETIRQLRGMLTL